MPMNQTIKFDHQLFSQAGSHISTLPDFNKTIEQAAKFHQLLLDSKDPIIKDNQVAMTGWKMDNPFVEDKKLIEIEETAQNFVKEIDDFISIGIGGSYLGIQATIEAVKGNIGLLNLLPSQKPRIYFLGNHMDPEYTATILRLVKDRKVGINVISKSGGTVEPAIAFAIAKDLAEGRIVATTDKAKGALKALADKEGYKTFVVPDNVGGRYSVTCPVGLFGLAAAGINIKEFIAGARFAEEQTRTQPFEKNIALQRATMRFLAYDKWNKKIEVASTGIYNLRMVTAWLQQLGPETEGKDGKGLWISPEFYTQDAHANGQMIQQGERNMIETFLMVEKVAQDITIPGKGTPVDYLDGKKLSFANQAFVEGLRDAHFEGGVPCMSYVFPEVTAHTIGQFYQYEMNAIAITGLLLGLNPFIQPGVQMYKAIANKKSGKH